MIEKDLQDFFKIHNKMWNEDTKYRFSQTQLDILDEYRGRPIYFA